MQRLSQVINLASGALILGFLLAVSAVALAQTKPEELAQQASNAWLALVDGGKYGESWQESSQLFQARITKHQWQDTLYATRDPLGKVVSRKMKSAGYTKSLPGVPDGEYVLFSTTRASSISSRRWKPSLPC